MPLELTHPVFLFGLLVLPILVWYLYRGLTDSRCAGNESRRLESARWVSVAAWCSPWRV